MRRQKEPKVGKEDLDWDQEQLGSQRNIECKEQKLSDWEHEILEIGRVLSEILPKDMWDKEFNI